MLVTLETVTKTYPLGETIVPAVTNATVGVSAGRSLVIAGPSGSGKTTILNLIGCIDRPDSGQIRIGGQDVLSMDEKSLTRFRSKHISHIFQTFNLIPVLSAWENVEYPLLIEGLHQRERRERISAILEQVGLADQMHKRPNQLSGGQRQRVAIARAIVKRPLLVLADEPTANLDSQTGKSILRLMRSMQEAYNTTFVFSSHDPNVIAEGDDHITMKDGEVVANVQESAGAADSERRGQAERVSS